jgi:large subunit ribosomal protein L18
MKLKRKDLDSRQRRQLRLRTRSRGMAERPRLNVFCSLRYVYAQIIDDATGRTLACASSLGGATGIAGSRGNTAAAKAVGALLAKNAKAAGVTKVVFDRAGYKYHGKVKALADAAREGGLVF